MVGKFDNNIRVIDPETFIDFFAHHVPEQESKSPISFITYLILTGVGILGVIIVVVILIKRRAKIKGNH
jgi:hypothetical protein